MSSSEFFNYFRKRQAFVAGQPYNSIEGYIIWSATTAALMRVHAGRLKRSFRPDGKRFVEGLIDLAPEMGKVAIPLAFHDLSDPGFPEPGDMPGRPPCRVLHVGLKNVAPFPAYRAAVFYSRIWTAEEDVQADELLDLPVIKGDPRANKAIMDNRYAAILYTEYRCEAVHGLDTGLKTQDGLGQATGIEYMNHGYGDPDPTPQEMQYETRICFPLSYLAELLERLIDEEEKACLAASYNIPYYATNADIHGK